MIPDGTRINRGHSMTRIEEIRHSTGLSRAAFSRKYNIPVRTIEGWEYGNRQPPEWLPGILEKAIKYDEEQGL